MPSRELAWAQTQKRGQVAFRDALAALLGREDERLCGTLFAIDAAAYPAAQDVNRSDLFCVEIPGCGGAAVKEFGNDPRSPVVRDRRLKCDI
jgi:hypothetical protein